MLFFAIFKKAVASYKEQSYKIVYGLFLVNSIVALKPKLYNKK